VYFKGDNEPSAKLSYISHDNAGTLTNQPDWTFQLNVCGNSSKYDQKCLLHRSSRLHAAHAQESIGVGHADVADLELTAQEIIRPRRRRAGYCAGPTLTPCCISGPRIEQHTNIARCNGFDLAGNRGWSKPRKGFGGSAFTASSRTAIFRGVHNMAHDLEAVTICKAPSVGA
jgi:hypothetical protein